MLSGKDIEMSLISLSHALDAPQCIRPWISPDLFERARSAKASSEIEQTLDS